MNSLETNLPEHHLNALNQRYNGEVTTLEEKLAYWQSEENGGPSTFSHDPSIELKVAMLEQCYLMNIFPQDFQYY